MSAKEAFDAAQAAYDVAFNAFEEDPTTHANLMQAAEIRTHCMHAMNREQVELDKVRKQRLTSEVEAESGKYVAACKELTRSLARLMMLHRAMGVPFAPPALGRLSLPALRGMSGDSKNQFVTLMTVSAFAQAQEPLP